MKESTTTYATQHVATLKSEPRNLKAHSELTFLFEAENNPDSTSDSLSTVTGKERLINP
jgi:hypothetical protein